MWWPPLGTGPASPSPRPDAQGAEVSETAAATHGDLELVEVEWGTSEGAALVERLMSDLDQRYAPSTIGDEPSPPGRPRAAPPAAEPDEPRWAIDPTTVVRPQGAFVVARLGGVPVGCGALRPLPGGSNGVAEVKRMFTAPEARGRGVARAVLERLVVIAQDLGRPVVVLETGTRQHEALALYQDAGWYPLEPYGEYRDHSLSRCFGLDLPR